jgi:hypothetical protein
MFLFGAPTPKRHVGWSNSPAVSFLNTGNLHGWQPAKNQDHKTYSSYVNADGVKCYHGTKYLKKTQTLACDKVSCYTLSFTAGNFVIIIVCC